MSKPPETVYRGRRLLGPANQHLGVEVTVNGLPLTAWRSQRLWNHSPTGFEWGYGGSGPAQLALALLYDVTRSRGIALAYYQDFKWAKVAAWGPEWEITAAEIGTWLDAAIAGRLRRPDYPASIDEVLIRPDAFVEGMKEGGAS